MADPTQTTIIRNDASLTVTQHFDRLHFLENWSERISSGWSLTGDVFEQVVAAAVAEHILNEEEGVSSLAWMLAFVMLGYERGRRRASHIISSAAKLSSLPVLSGRPFLPFDSHRQVQQVLRQHIFSQVSGITESMKKQISAVVTQGILGHQSFEMVAANIMKRIDVAESFAKRVARTAVVHAWNLASIEAAEDYSRILNRPIYVIWFTNVDGLERYTHNLRHNRIFTRDQARSLLGEPNCRCSTKPYFGDRRPAFSIPTSLIS